MPPGGIGLDFFLQSFLKELSVSASQMEAKKTKDG